MTNLKITKDIISQILKDYDLGTYKSHEMFTAGAIQINIKLKTNKGVYALRIYQTRTFEYVQFELNVLNYLFKHKFPTPMPFRTIHGKLTTNYKKFPVAIFNFVKGKHIKAPSKEQRKQVIHTLAKMHNLTFQYNPKYENFRESLDHKYVTQVIKTEVKKFKGSKKGRERFNYIKNELKNTLLPKSLPKGVVHGDYDVGNILFEKNLTGVLDFDNACYTNLIYDVAMLIYYWTSFKDSGVDFKESKNLINLYQEIRPLNDTEKKYLFDQLKMICLVYSGWFFYNSINKSSGSDIFEKSKKRIEHLNSIGREKFYEELFD